MKEFFENGYGISIITKEDFFGAYTSKEKPYEIAVLKGTKEKWSLCYDTPITDDVIGYLTWEEVLDYQEKIKNLPKDN